METEQGELSGLESVQWAEDRGQKETVWWKNERRGLSVPLRGFPAERLGDGGEEKDGDEGEGTDGGRNDGSFR